MFSYMKMKAIKKKRKKLAAAGAEVAAVASSFGYDKSRRRSSGYDADALARVAARTRREAVTSTLDDESTLWASQETEEVLDSPHLKDVDSTQFKPKERKKKDAESTQYQPREAARKRHAVLEKISSESTDVLNSSKKTSRSDYVSLSYCGRTPSVFTDELADSATSAWEITLTKSRRLESARQTDASAKGQVVKSRKKSSSSKNGSLGSDSEKSDTKSRSDDRKCKKGKVSETDCLQFQDVPDSPSFSKAAEKDAEGDLKKPLLESHGRGSPSEAGGLGMFSIARKLHNLWKFKKRSMEYLSGAARGRGPPREEVPSARHINGHWDDVTQESPSVIHDFIRKQMKSNSLSLKIEDEAKPQPPKHPIRDDIYSVFKEIQKQKEEKASELDSENSPADDEQVQRVSFKDTVKKIMKNKTRASTGDVVEDLRILRGDNELDKEDGLLEGVAFKLLVLDDAQETKKDAESKGKDSERGSSLVSARPNSEALRKDEREISKDKHARRRKEKDDEDIVEAGPDEHERPLRHYNEGKTRQGPLSPKVLLKGLKVLDNIESFRKKQEICRTESLKELEEVEDEKSYASPETRKGKYTRHQIKKLYSERKPGPKGVSPVASRQVSRTGRDGSPTFTLETITEARPRKKKEDAEERQLIYLSKDKKPKGESGSISRKESEKTSEESSSKSVQSSEKEWEKSSTSRQRRKEAKKSPLSVHKRTRKDMKWRTPSISRQANGESSEELSSISNESIEEAGEISLTSRQRRKESRKKSSSMARQQSRDARDISPTLRNKTKAKEKRPSHSREKNKTTRDGSPSISRQTSKEARAKSPSVSRQISQEAGEASPKSRHRKKKTRERSPPSISRQPSEEMDAESHLLSSAKVKKRKQKSPSISRPRRKQGNEDGQILSQQGSEGSMEDSSSSQEEKDKVPLVYRKKSKQRRRKNPPISREGNEEDREGSPKFDRKRRKEKRRRRPSISRERSEKDQEGSPTFARKRSKDKRRNPPVSRERSEEDPEGSPKFGRKRGKEKRRRNPPISRDRGEEDQEGSHTTERKRSKDLRRYYDEEEEPRPKRHRKKRSPSRAEIEDPFLEGSPMSSERNVTRERRQSRDKTPTSKGLSEENAFKETGRHRRERRKRDDEHDTTEADVGRLSGIEMRRGQEMTSPERRLSKLGFDKSDRQGSQRAVHFFLSYTDSQYSYTDDDLSSVEVFSTDHSSSTTTTSSTTSSHDSKTTSSTSDNDNHTAENIRLPQIDSANLFTAKSRKEARQLFLSQLSKPFPLSHHRESRWRDRSLGGIRSVGKRHQRNRHLNVRLPTLEDTMTAMLKLARKTQDSYNIPIMDLGSCDYPQKSSRAEAKLYIEKFGITELLQARL